MAPQIFELQDTPPWHHLFGFTPAPRKLFLLGEPQSLNLLERLPLDGLAVVGTRNAQPRGLLHLSRCIQRLAGPRLIILSGLARGTDTAAHRAALSAGLPTIAVLPGGIDKVYPPENTPLSQQIIQNGGLLVSEHPVGFPIFPGQFLRRNRLIAGWARATWVVQAGQRLSLIHI